VVFYYLDVFNYFFSKTIYNDYICSYYDYKKTKEGLTMENKPKPTSIRLKPDLKKKIEELAEKEDRSFNNMIARLLEQAVA